MSTILGTHEWERDVLEHVAEHGQRERELLDAYRELSDDEELSPAFRFLARMILEDEERHHRMFESLAIAMRDGEHADGAIPSLQGLRGDRHQIWRLTNELLALERDDLRELKRLARQLKELGQTTMWVLLIELMIADTRKHMKILRFIRKRAGDQPD